jgi:hypothetical protein
MSFHILGNIHGECHWLLAVVPLGYGTTAASAPPNGSLIIIMAFPDDTVTIVQEQEQMCGNLAHITQGLIRGFLHFLIRHILVFGAYSQCINEWLIFGSSPFPAKCFDFLHDCPPFPISDESLHGTHRSPAQVGILHGI